MNPMTQRCCNTNEFDRPKLKIPDHIKEIIENGLLEGDKRAEEKMQEVRDVIYGHRLADSNNHLIKNESFLKKVNQLGNDFRVGELCLQINVGKEVYDLGGRSLNHSTVASVLSLSVNKGLCKFLKNELGFIAEDNNCRAWFSFEQAVSKEYSRKNDALTMESAKFIIIKKGMGSSRFYNVKLIIYNILYAQTSQNRI